METYRMRPDLDEGAQKELGEYDALTQKLLYSRGIKTKKEAEIFLSPDWNRDVGDPFDILGMERAVIRILSAIDREEKILIYGDFDCDGIPGSAILHDLFQKIGYENFSNYVPHRHDEGYGFHQEAVEVAAEDGVKLIITVDVGIVSFDAVDRARALDIDCIITDHHLPKVSDGVQVLPDAYVILNSKQEADTYQDDMLCGAGVAWKLAQAVLTLGRKQGKFADVPEGWEKWLLDMAGISTIADMVPLRKENRVLAYYGLQVLRKSRRKGLMAILQKTGVKQGTVTEDDIGFMIAPRVNAASRMDHPLRALELLTAGEDAEAIRLANYIDHVNDQRKGFMASMVKEARKKLSSRELHEVIVLGSPDWHPGILGLAATKLVEEYGRPVFIWGHDGGGKIKGSVRSDGSVSVVNLMARAPEGTFIQFGGHDGAGGFSVEKNDLHTLEVVLSEVYKKMERQEAEEILQIDAVLTPEQVNWETFEKIDRFAPFGMDNAKPQFLFRNISLCSVWRFGKGKEHINISFRNSDGIKISAIGFFAGADIMRLAQKGKTVDLVANFEKSNYRKNPELRLRIVALFDSE